MHNKTLKPMAILLVIAMVMGMMGSLLPNVTAGDPNITGTVISATSPFEPIQGVTVTYIGDDGNTSYDITDSLGKFSLFVIYGNTSVDFNLTYDATEDGYELRTEAFNTSYYDGDVADVGTIGLESLPKVYGVIEDEDGTSIIDVEVTIQKGAEVHDLLTKTGGTFSQYVSDGLWNLTYYKDGYYYQEELSVQIAGADKDMGTISMEMISPEPTVEVWGYVHEKDGGAINGAKVSISTGDDKWITSKTDANGSYSMYAYPGTFQIKAMKDGYETNLSEEWLVVPSDATAVWRDIDLPAIPSEDYAIYGKVTDGTNPILDAIVTLQRTDGKYQKSTLTDALGDYDFMYSGEFRVVVEMDGYFTEVWPFTIDNTNDTDVLGDIEMTLIDNNKTVSGFIGDLEEQSPIAGADVTLYDRNELYTLTTTSGDNGYYSFDVYYESDFVMLVDAEGYQAEVVDIPDITSDVNEPVWLTTSPKDIITTKYTFADWSTISVVEKTILVVDNVSERVNADRRWGMGGVLGLSLNNWVVDEPGETDDWAEYLKQKELETKDTAKFLSLDNVYYELDDSVDLVVKVEEAVGPILTTTGAINITKTYNYTITTTPAAADEYTLVFNASYDTFTLDMVYELYLPDGYEMTSSETETTYITIEGYNDPISIDTAKVDGEYETVTMDIEKSENGTAVAALTYGLYYELNSTDDGYEVIVSAPQDGIDTEITFNAMSSSDPVGDINKANFTWNFGDGDSGNASLGWGMTTTYNYSAAGSYVIKLDITETGGDVTTTEFDIHVDGINPVANIAVNDTDDNATLSGTTVTINEDMTLTFNGLGSSDGAVASNDGLGEIEKYFWIWGDDSVNSTVTMNEDNYINHTYNTPGTYSLQMMVTDVVGHESAYDTLSIVVKDITSPAITDITLYDENGDETDGGIESQKLYMSANETTDNADDFEDLVFSWDLDDDGVTDVNGSWVSWTFEEVGNKNVTVFVTDTAGNEVNFTKVVNVRIGDRANLLLEAATFTFDPEEGTVGKTTTISVNITNNGQANATGVGVKFFIRDVDGNDVDIIGTVSLTIDGVSVTTIAPLETATASIDWKPSKKGTYTIWANASTPDEHESQWDDNNNIGFWEYSTYTVAEAGWIVPAIIGGVIVAIIAVFFFTRYFMNTRASDIKPGEKKKRK